ncbi:hypothetical protein EDF40_1410 [Curtobacterium sp. PhB170]|nr:hypothetical protein EDF40_1410 [Curtobacterium sp. PhB170]
MQRIGWAVSTGTPEEVLRVIRWDPVWSAMPNRPGASRQSTVLKPMTRAEAPQRSLSATYGLDAQPLHTDGAHLTERPDVIMLACADTSTTDTLVRAFQPGNLPDFVFSGVFTVNTGKSKFLAPAYDGALRFDPVAMRPSDYLSRRTVEYFAAERANAHHHRWEDANMLLFINNRLSLHARDAITEDADSRRVARYAFRIERDA